MRSVVPGSLRRGFDLSMQPECFGTAGVSRRVADVRVREGGRGIPVFFGSAWA